MDKPLVLIVDDEERVLDLLDLYLQNAGFEVVVARNGQQALELARQRKPDVVLLDLMLPLIDGIEVCKLLRQQSSLPIIMLTAKDDDADKVLGLEIGADDYITKPFNPREVVARIRAILRRISVQQAAERLVRLPGLEISLDEYKVKLNGEQKSFTPKETELLWLLASHPEQVFTREQLLEKIWGYEYTGDTRTVDTHIKRIRQKINTACPCEIKTVWGVGYRFEVRL